MNGFFQLGMKMKRVQAERGCIRGARRPVLLWALLFLALGLGSGYLLAQQPPAGGHPDPDAGRENEPDPTAVLAERRKAPAIVPPPAGMSYTTNLDHTAVWVGDQFHYMITVDYTPDYEFVVDNLTKETVNMDPLQAVDVGKKTITLKNKNKRLFVDLTLTSFATTLTTLQIPQFTLYYFRKDRPTTGAEQAAAESLTVPGPVIGLRSTLPPDPNDIRDAITVNSWGRTRWILPAAGLASLVILVSGLGWQAALFIRRRKSRKGPDRRKAMEAVRARWISGVPSDFSDPQTAMEFYGHSYQALKEYLGYYLGTSMMGLTAEELQEAMQRLDVNTDFTQKVVNVLASCEVARYARDGMATNAEAAHGMAQNIREILSLGSKTLAGE